MMSEKFKPKGLENGKGMVINTKDISGLNTKLSDLLNGNLNINILEKCLPEYKVELSDFDVIENTDVGVHGKSYIVQHKMTKIICCMNMFEDKATFKSINDAFIREVIILSHFRDPFHPNFVGYCLDPPIVVVEYISNGDLFSSIHPTSSSRFKLNSTQKSIMAIGIALGLSNLHRAGFVFKNLNSINIMIDCHFHPRLLAVDSMILADGIKTKDFAGSPFWSAPEVLLENTASAKSDVYSFGIILWEMFTGELPFDYLSEGKYIEKVAKNKERPGIPPEVPEPIALLIEKCWAHEPELRPTSETVCITLLQNPCIFPETNLDSVLCYIEKFTHINYQDQTSVLLQQYRSGNLNNLPFYSLPENNFIFCLERVIKDIELKHFNKFLVYLKQYITPDNKYRSNQIIIVLNKYFHERKDLRLSFIEDQHYLIFWDDIFYICRESIVWNFVHGLFKDSIIITRAFVNSLRKFVQDFSGNINIILLDYLFDPNSRFKKDAVLIICEGLSSSIQSKFGSLILDSLIYFMRTDLFAHHKFLVKSVFIDALSNEDIEIKRSAYRGLVGIKYKVPEATDYISNDLINLGLVNETLSYVFMYPDIAPTDDEFILFLLDKSRTEPKFFNFIFLLFKVNTHRVPVLKHIFKLEDNCVIDSGQLYKFVRVLFMNPSYNREIASYKFMPKVLNDIIRTANHETIVTVCEFLSKLPFSLKQYVKLKQKNFFWILSKKVRVNGKADLIFMMTFVFHTVLPVIDLNEFVVFIQIFYSMFAIKQLQPYFIRALQAGLKQPNMREEIKKHSWKKLLDNGTIDPEYRVKYTSFLKMLV